MFAMEKHSFDFINHDGILLNIHHTIAGKNRVRMLNICFTDNSEMCSAVDHKGNIFMFDLKSQQFWILPQAKIDNCTCMTFVPLAAKSCVAEQPAIFRNLILIGTADGKILCVNFEQGTTSSSAVAHLGPVQRITFTTTLCNKGRMYFLSHSLDDIKIYDLTPNRMELRQELNHMTEAMREPQDIVVGGRFCKNFTVLEAGWDANTRIVCSGFIPHTSKIYIGLSSDSIQVWNWGLRTIRQTVQPFRMRQRHLRRSPPEPLDILYDSDEPRVDELVVQITKETGKNVISDVQFSRSGVFCCVAMQFLNELIVFYTSTATINSKTSYTTSTAYIPLWQVYKIIKLNDFAIATVKFISPWLPPSHPMALTSVDAKYLALSSNSTRDLLLINIDDLNRKAYIQKDCGNFAVAPNGKMLGSVGVESGQITIHCLQYYFDLLSRSYVFEVSTKKPRYSPILGIEKRLEKIHNEMNKIISRSRLLPILKEFGSYPIKYRPTIWRNILKSPQNNHSNCSNQAFQTLLRKGYHPCVASYDTQFPLFDQKAVRNLKKICSCLAHWCSLFAHLPLLPNFVFPFLKHWRFDSVSCFETIACIMLNQGQLWFEFAPLEPYNYLGMVENLLAHFDPGLMSFYQEQQVNVHIYAWEMIQTALSEIFDETDWLQVWDHILTNEPEFLMFFLCAFNVIQRDRITQCTTIAEIQAIFHQPTSINMNMMLRRCYHMQRTCPRDINPCQYMKPFKPLHLDVVSRHYQPFELFPKMLFEAKTEEMMWLSEQEKETQRKFEELQQKAKDITEYVEDQIKTKMHENRMHDIESMLNGALAQERKKLEKLQAAVEKYRQQIQMRELVLFPEIKNSLG